MRDRVRKAWRTIDAVLAREDPETHVTLAPGAREEQIGAVEEALGSTLPEDFRESLRLHNGQDDPGSLHSFVDHGVLLSCAKIVERRDMLNRIDADGLEQARVEGRPINAGEWWNRHYVPFLDANGNMLCIDLDPSHGNQFAELVWHVHDSNIERGAAPSYVDWLEKIAARLHANEFTIDHFDRLSVVSHDFGR